jgi:hypothetical protein
MINFVNRWCAEGLTPHGPLGVGQALPALRRVASLLNLPYAEIN